MFGLKAISEIFLTFNESEAYLVPVKKKYTTFNPGATDEKLPERQIALFTGDTILSQACNTRHVMSRNHTLMCHSFWGPFGNCFVSLLQLSTNFHPLRIEEVPFPSARFLMIGCQNVTASTLVLPCVSDVCVCVCVWLRNRC